MPTIDELKATLIKADQAGDIKSARILTKAIDERSALQGQPQEEIVTPEPITPEPEGIVAKTKELFTGEARTTPEIEALPTIGELPELNEISVAGLKSAFSTVTADPEEAAKALKVNFPEIEVRQDEKGNLIVKSAVNNQEYVINKPGLDIRDIARGGLLAAIFARTGGLSGLLPKITGAAVTQAGLETAQAVTGGEFDPEQIPLAGATELIAPGVGKAIGGVKGLVRGVKGLLPGAKAALSTAEEAVRTAEQAGITPLTTDIRPPTTFAGKVGQAVTERIPLVGTGPLRVKQQAQRVEAVRNVLRDFGADETAQASDDVMSELLKKRGKDVTKFTNLKNDVIEKLTPKGNVGVESTIQTLDDEILKLQALNTKSVEPVINMFTDFKQAIADQNLNNIELLRRQLGEQLKDPSLASVRSTGEKALSKIYTSIRDDMGSFIKEQGEPRDFAKWKIGNTRLSKMIGELEVGSLKSALKKGEATPESVRRMLFNQNQSEIKLLFKNLPPEGRNRAKVAIFQEVVQKAGGIDVITPEKFVRQMKKFEKSTGIFLNSKDKQTVNGLIKALDLTKQAAIAGVKPATGAELTTFAAPSAITWLLGGEPLTGLAAVAGIGATARAYESKPIRNLLLQLAKAPRGKEQDILNKLTPLIQSFRQTSTKE